MAKSKKKTGRNKNAAAKPKPQETKTVEVIPEKASSSPAWIWGVLVVVILFAAFVRYGLADVPMERDEGEYAYAGRLILDGIPPFAEAYNMKMPGVYGAYAAIMSVLGQTDTAVRLGLIVVNAATGLLLFLSFRRRMDEPEAVAGAAGFLAITLLPSLQGFMANAEHFVILFAALGLYLLLVGLDGKKWWLIFLGGLGFGLAFLMKQHGVLFILFGGVYLIWSILKEPKIEWLKQAVVYIVGAVVPFGVTCLIMAKAGILDKFYYWTFAYAGEYASMVEFSKGMGYLTRRLGAIAGDVPLVMILALIGLAGSAASKRLRVRWPFFFGFFVFSFLAVCPGFYFRPHYFILFAPALALAAGVGLVMIGRGLAAKIPLPATVVSLAVLVIISFGFPFIAGSSLYFKMLPESVSRAVYGGNPFPEARRVGEYIKEHAKEGDRLLVFGSEPQIYFYSGLKAATGFMYTYALMEKHPYARDMQKDMAAEVEFADPRYVVQVSVPMSWLVKRGSDPFIFKWAEQYLRGRYKVIGWADILPAGETRYVFGEKAAEYKPESKYWLAIYEKNPKE